VANAHALALDDVLARGRHVQQQVNQVVIQQVDLVDVEKSAVGACQQARLKRPLALRQRLFKIQRANNAVLGGTERQVNHRHGPLCRCATGRAGLTHWGRLIGRTVVDAVGNARHRRQKIGEPAHRRRLACATVAKHHDAADASINSGNQQRTPHLFLSGNGAEGKWMSHARHRPVACHDRLTCVNLA